MCEDRIPNLPIAVPKVSCLVSRQRTASEVVRAGKRPKGRALKSSVHHAPKPCPSKFQLFYFPRLAHGSIQENKKLAFLLSARLRYGRWRELAWTWSHVHRRTHSGISTCALRSFSCTVHERGGGCIIGTILATSASPSHKLLRISVEGHGCGQPRPVLLLQAPSC